MSDNNHTTVRIVDIARMAGVSAATVDRVIHNRGKVSAENLARINEVLRRVDYRPNLIARSLASGRRYTICVVMPRFAPGEYWADFEAGIARSEAEAMRYNVVVRRFYFDQYDRTSFDNLLETLRCEEFDGAVIATLFAERVEPFARELDARGVPYVFVDSDIPACNRLAYFGTSSFDAGAVAARLLSDRLDPEADIVVGRIVPRGDGGSNQWRNREAGFRSYLEAHGFRGRLHYAALRLDDETYNTRVLDELMRSHPQVAGAVTFNSTCYILAGYLAARRLEGVRLVGYDVIRRNGEMLSAGVVTALVAQRPEAQGYRAVMALCEWFVEGRAPARVNNMPIDILLKENIPYYTNNII
ncbi:LacI family DNA-binding transcriptional regulator [Alistipes sp.]|uniref:LacI family DNA-binding transcriptional regulator n=1 Tax=Alistipes sp. TaxID=1872444 RepID=UPI0025C4726F|nr:LacI family DNA-binding transcriptional regulator [Alistipes sp.]